jgi:hypothetical protein
VPPAWMSQDKFWLNARMDCVPECFRPADVPESIREDLPRLFASYRSDTCLGTGSRNSRRLRDQLLIPALLDSLPHLQAPQHLVLAERQVQTHTEALGQQFLNQLALLHVIPLEELKIFNRNQQDVVDLVQGGWQPTIQHTFQVLPRRMHMHRVAQERLLGVTFINCPSRRVVHCVIPVVPANVDESPSAKRGGYALVTKKFIKVRCLAINIPREILIDCREFETGHKVFLKDVQLGQGRSAVGASLDECLLVMETSG